MGLLALLVDGLNLGLLRILGDLRQRAVEYRWLVLGIELAALPQSGALVDLLIPVINGAIHGRANGYDVRFVLLLLLLVMLLLWLLMLLVVLLLLLVVLLLLLLQLLLVLLRRLELMQLLLLLRGRRWLLLRMQAGWMLMRRNLRTTLAILPPHRGQVGYINGALADGN